MDATALAGWLDTARPNWRTDPAQAVCDWANAPATVQRDRVLATVSECWASVDPAEYTALTAANKAYVDRIFSGAEVPLGNGPVRTRLAAVFGAGTATRTNLLALYQEAVQESPAQAAGFGTLYPGHIIDAKGA